MHPLNRIEWHDLPVAQIAITASGITLKVTPFNDVTGVYEEATLTITNAASLKLGVQGEFTPKDLDGMEINRFDFSEPSEGRIDGKLCILLNNAGVWLIEFHNAEWRLDCSPNRNSSQ